jgi:biopolymer transport protein ExbD
MGAKLDSGVGKKRGRPDVNADPNVIPFIDVMLVLLIIFMVASPIAAVDIRTNMPDSKVSASKRVNKPVWITVVDGKDCEQKVRGIPPSACPSVYVGEDEVDFESVGFRAREAVKASDKQKSVDPQWIEDQRVYVRASGETQYKVVTRVMNRLQDSRLTKIGLVADDKRK